MMATTTRGWVVPDPALDERLRRALVATAGAVSPDTAARDRMLGALARRRARHRAIAAGALVAVLAAVGVVSGLSAGGPSRPSLSASGTRRSAHGPAGTAACGTLAVGDGQPACAGTLVVAAGTFSPLASPVAAAPLRAEGAPTAGATAQAGAPHGATAQAGGAIPARNATEAAPTAAGPGSSSPAAGGSGITVRIGQRLTVRLPGVPGLRWSVPEGGAVLRRTAVHGGSTGAALSVTYTAERTGTLWLQAVATALCGSTSGPSGAGASGASSTGRSRSTACTSASATWMLPLTVVR